MQRKIQFTWIVILLFFTEVTCAQITFQKIYELGYGAFGYSLQQTSDGGYIMTGEAFVSPVTSRVLLIKADSSGNITWTRTYEGNHQSGAVAVRQTMDGGYILTGAMLDTAASRLCLIKTNSSGDTLWTKIYGGQSSASDIQQTTDSGYVICGNTGYGAGITDVYLLRINAYGDTLWTKTYGGNNFEQGNAVQQTADSGFIIAGHTVTFGAQGHQGLYLVKTNSFGDTLWTKSIGGIVDDRAYAVCQTNDGGYIAAGNTGSFGAGSEDIYLVKTDSIGNVLWNKTYGGANYETAYSVAKTFEGGYILAGLTNSFVTSNVDIFLIKTDTLGNILWSKTYGGISSEYAYSVVQTSDSGFAVLGYSLSFGTGAGAFYLVKTDIMGNSGCNETNAAFTVSSPVPGVINTPTLVGSTNTLAAILPVIVDSAGTDSTLCTAVGMEEIIPENTFMIFPNPSDSQIQISGNDNRLSHIEIYNVVGQKIYNTVFSGKSKIITLHVSPGIYFVKIVDGQRGYIEKLIIGQE